MVKKLNRRQNKPSSILGAVIIESLAVVGMLGLFYTLQDERTKTYTVEELVKPEMVYLEPQTPTPEPNLMPVDNLEREQSSRRLAQYGSRFGFASSER